MSTASRLGYDAERASQLWLQDNLGHPLYRPRAGSVEDLGDLLGLPMTVSVKNHRSLALAQWVTDMETQAARNNHDAGIVIHKRRGKGSPDHWYVTTTGRMWLPMATAYVASVKAGER